MGLNKEYLDKQRVLSIVKNGGIEKLIETIRKSEVLITMDDYSKEIVQNIQDNNIDKLKF
jgi:hypothetical protein